MIYDASDPARGRAAAGRVTSSRARITAFKYNVI
jgi:hypothetical protein